MTTKRFGLVSGVDRAPRAEEHPKGGDGEGSGSGATAEAEEPAGPAERAALAAHQVLLDAAAVCQVAGSVAPGDLAPLALSAWSAVHGLAVLVLTGPEGEVAHSPGEVDRAARTVTETLARGLLAR